MCSALLSSVFEGTRPPDETIVVDNGSSDGSPEQLEERFPSIKLIRNGANLLVTKAFNIGMRAADGDAMLLVADDNVLDAHCIEELERCLLEHADVGMVGPIQYHYDEPNRVWYAGAHTNLATGLTRFFRKPHVLAEGYGYTQSIPNCVLLRRAAYDRVGGFDEEAFPMHNEEADLAFRMRRAGLKAAIALRAKEYHRVAVPAITLPLGSGDYNVDNPVRAELHARSRVLLARRYANLLEKFVYFPVFMPLTVLAYSIITFCKGGPALAAAFVRGTLAGLTSHLARNTSLYDAFVRVN